MFRRIGAVSFILTLVLLTFTLTACNGNRQPAGWIEKHIQASDEKLETHIQESQERFEYDSVPKDGDSDKETQENPNKPAQKTSGWIENHIREAEDKLNQHIEHSEKRLDRLTGKD